MTLFFIGARRYNGYTGYVYGDQLLAAGSPALANAPVRGLRRSLGLGLPGHYLVPVLHGCVLLSGDPP